MTGETIRGSGECPTEDMLGAMVARALSPDEAAQIAAHLDTCDACRQAALAAVRARPTASSPVGDFQGSSTFALGTPSGASGPVAAAPKLLTAARIGQHVGRFEVRKLLGAGGMGQVYEAYDAELDRSIALKVLRPELASAAAVLAERLVRESRMMAKVVHPAVITVHDVGRDGDAVFIAMELVRGQTLGAYVATRKLGWREIVALYERAGAGLAAAHAVGLVHRDFKPDNVLVEGDAARVVVTDFGIARATTGDADDDDAAADTAAAATPRDIKLTATGAAVGTPAYMAPEQLAGGAVDLRADVFAFAVALWEALFGTRPFAGRTVAAIRAAMAIATATAAPPRAPSTVPPRLGRALERGLAIDPAARWPDLGAFTAELAAIRAPHRTLQFAGGGAVLVGLGVAAAALWLGTTADPDPCAAGRAAIGAAYTPDDAVQLQLALSAQPKLAAAIGARVDGLASQWRAMHAATCFADREPAQPIAITGCLDARRIELGGVVDDIIADGPRYADKLLALPGEATHCAFPAIALQFARVPEAPALRRKVTQLRYALFAAEAARDQQDYAGAVAAATRLEKDAAATWAPVDAEALYLLGTSQSFASKTDDATATLRRAAAVAETSHNDYISANAWIQLAQSATSDAGTPARGYEYLQYANAAIDRLGRPLNLVAMYDYVLGATLVDLHRNKEAEVAFRECVALADVWAPFLRAEAIQGLGFVYEDEGRLGDAIAEYRRALAKLPPDDASPSAFSFRERLGEDLAMAGQVEEAERIARQAVAIATRTLGEDTLDTQVARLELSDVLEQAGKFEAARGVAHAATAKVKALVGERSARYAGALRTEASILQDLERSKDAQALYETACNVIAFANGDDSADLGECLVNEAQTTYELGRRADALAMVERALKPLHAAYGDAHPQIAQALLTRAVIERRDGRHAASVKDFEDGIAMFAATDAGPGHLAAAEVEFVKELWVRDRARAKVLLAKAIKDFDGAPPTWNKERAVATEWLATDGHPEHAED